MNIYIAGSITGRDRINQHAKELTCDGHRVLSAWLSPQHFIESAWKKDYGDEIAEAMAMSDLYHVLEADMVILDTIDKSSSGGSDTELGLALMRSLEGKLRVVHIGPYRNIFQSLVREHYNTWEEFFNEASI